MEEGETIMERFSYFFWCAKFYWTPESSATSFAYSGSPLDNFWIVEWFQPDFSEYRSHYNEVQKKSDVGWRREVHIKASKEYKVVMIH